MFLMMALKSRHTSLNGNSESMYTDAFALTGLRQCLALWQDLRFIRHDSELQDHPEQLRREPIERVL